MPYDSQRDRNHLPLASDVERLVTTLIMPQANILRKLAAAERLYTVMPTYILRTLTTSAIRLVGKEALYNTKSNDYDSKRYFYATTLKSMLNQMNIIREKIVEVKLPPIMIPEGFFNEPIHKIIEKVSEALTNWFYSATEEARKKGEPFSEDTAGYVLLITFASLIIVNGLRELALIGD